MYLGYQGELIAMAAESKEELEKIPFIKFDRIEETSENYELFNGRYYPVNKELVAVKNEEIRKQRQSWYEQHTDPLASRKLRRQALGVWTDEDEAAFAAEIKSLMIELENKFPYVITEEVAAAQNSISQGNTEETENAAQNQEV